MGCIVVTSSALAKWRKDNPEKYAVHLRRSLLKRKYGLTLGDYGRMLAEQGGTCAICGAGPDSERNHRFTSLAVDHDHETGQVRGLLCSMCNRGIGVIGDHNLAAAAAYIQKMSINKKETVR